MFSETYIQECINNADRLREEWEKRGPRQGDYYWDSDDGEVHLIGSFSEAGRIREWFSYSWFKGSFPLFQPRQIMRMLEERGQYWFLGKMDALMEDEVGGPAEPDYRCVLDGIDVEGPDPATALLRAYLEVVKDE